MNEPDVQKKVTGRSKIVWKGSVVLDVDVKENSVNSVKKNRIRIHGVKDFRKGIIRIATNTFYCIMLILIFDTIVVNMMNIFSCVTRIALNICERVEFIKKRSSETSAGN